jgi:hypothetical protein
MNHTTLKYEGRLLLDDPTSPKIWTITSHFIDHNGYDRFRGTLGLNSLWALGIVPIPVDSGCGFSGHCEHAVCCYCAETEQIKFEALTLLKGAK